jgi:hypothetical protein
MDEERNGSEAKVPEPSTGSSTWSVVVRAQGSGPRAEAALNALIRRYDRTVMTMVRSYRLPWNLSPEDVKQRFFLDMIRLDAIRKLQPSDRYRFRSWLSVAVRNSVFKQCKAWLTQTGGERVTLLVRAEQPHGVTPELLVERQYAEDTVLYALERHRAMAKDKARFELWARVLPGPQLDIPELADLAAAFDLTIGSAAVRKNELKRRHERILSEVIADTLDVDANTPEGARAIEEEKRRLYRVLTEVPAEKAVVQEDA